MLAEKHSDEKLSTTLLIVETGIIAYHFEKIKDGKYINDILGGQKSILPFVRTNYGFSKSDGGNSSNRK